MNNAEPPSWTICIQAYHGFSCELLNKDVQLTDLTDSCWTSDIDLRTTNNKPKICKFFPVRPELHLSENRWFRCYLQPYGINKQCVPFPYRCSSINTCPDPVNSSSSLHHEILSQDLPIFPSDQSSFPPMSKFNCEVYVIRSHNYSCYLTMCGCPSHVKLVLLVQHYSTAQSELDADWL
jgi:hypothetical protein